MAGTAAMKRPDRQRRKTGGAPDRLWEARVRDIWRYITTQPASFWLANFYLFLEYVRPQSIWTGLAFLPWTQVSIWLGIGGIVFEGRFLKLPTAGSKLMLAFTAIVVLSGVMAIDPSLSWEAISLPLSWAVVFVLIVNTITTERRFFVAMLGFLLYSFKMSQHGARTWLEIGFGFQDWGATGAPGWFHNSGEFGIQMCVFFPLALYFMLGLRPYWSRWKTLFFLALPVTAVMSMVASSSRGALVGFAVILVWIVARTRYRVRALVGVAILAAVTWAVVPPEQIERFSTAGEDETSVNRLTRWENGIEIANEYPILGIGYNNWGPYNLARYGSAGLSHNIFIEAWSELGYVGLSAFLAMIVATFVMNRNSRKLARGLGERGRFLYHMGFGLDGALVGYMASGFFVTVLYYPYFWINLAFTVALRLATLDTVRRERRRQKALATEPRPLKQPEVIPLHTAAAFQR